jgi:hypothetical protein
LQLFVSNPELGFLGFVEPATQSRFVGTDDAIGRHVVAFGDGLAARELAFGVLLVEAADPCEVGAAVGAVTGTQRSRVVPLRKAGRAVGRNIVGREGGCHGILLKKGGHPRRGSVRAAR